MKVGFTGTRRGMTEAQRLTVRALLGLLGVTEAHHGDCVGADADFAAVCAALEPRPRIIAHPGESAAGGENHLRANSPHNDEVLSVKTHFARNRDIVTVCDVLIATPADPVPQTRGGTWYTIDYAGKKGRRRFIVWPDGNGEESVPSGGA